MERNTQEDLKMGCSMGECKLYIYIIISVVK